MVIFTMKDKIMPVIILLDYKNTFSLNRLYIKAKNGTEKIKINSVNFL